MENINLMIILLSLLAAVVLIILVRVAFGMLRTDDEEKSVLEMRKKQSASSFRQNALKKTLEDLVEKRAKVGKKSEIEEICLQAGFNISYGEYRLISYFTGLIIAASILTGLNNILMAIIFMFIGSWIPGQIIHAIRNKRVQKMDAQVGSFMRLVIERYASTRDFSKSIQETTNDFKGQEPIYSELRHVSADLNIGVNVADAMRKFAKRSGNSYLTRMTDYYEISADLGTVETRQNLLKQALRQYEENRTMKSKLKNELSAPAREAYLMVAMVPFVSIYMSSATPEYKEFMLGTAVGQYFITGVVLVILGVVWFINKQIGKPLD